MAGSALHWGFVHFPPFHYQTEEGSAEGLLVDLVDRVMASVDREYSFQQYPNRRMIHLLNEGKLDLAVVMTSVLKDKALYRISQQPVSSMQLSAFWLGEREPVTRVGDLFGSRVILMSGFSYGGIRHMLEPAYGVVREVVEVDKHGLGIDALRLDRGDYLLNYKETATLEVQEHELADINHSVLNRVDIYFLLRADLPGSAQLMQQIEAALAVIQSNH
ncbi:MAG: transporter substrate-binding domain-containing protein [Alkalimonas sp.]|nr:transporter substrate-binding domain-containing protein [Alkalimonas sp.]